MKRDRAKTITAYKVTRPDGTDFYSGTLNYAAACESKIAVEVADAEAPTGRVCGHGVHVCRTAIKAIQFANRSMRPWRYWEGEIRAADIIEEDEQKVRVRAFRPLRELSLRDIFGDDFGTRVDAASAEARSWRDIPWLKPRADITDAMITGLVADWRAALTPFMRAGAKLPAAVRIVSTAAAAYAAYAYAAAGAADAAAAAAAASVAHVGLVAADAADAAAADAVAAADAAADAVADAADADAAVAAAAAAADAVADAADADAYVAAAADAAAYVAAAAAAADWPYWLRYYVRPYWVLRRYALWKIAAVDGENPWEPMVELYRSGCLPIGFAGGAFVVYRPSAKRKGRRVSR